MKKEELLNLSYEEKVELIKEGKYLEVFVNDACISVRYDVANQGYGLDRLRYDRDDDVREVARQKR